MFPWFLCFLSAPPSELPDRSLSEFSTEQGVWWNPMESDRNLNGFEIQEGDILVPASAKSSLKNAIKSKKYLWQNGTIPYVLGDDFSCSEKELILDAMKILEEKTCIKFVEKETQETFIEFQKEKNGCYAPIGTPTAPTADHSPLTFKYVIFPPKRYRTAVEQLNLFQSPECFKQRGIIEHELLHVAGLFHEQSRPDRDDFVTIHWCNIQPNREIDFLKGNFNEMSTFDLPYDYASIMHYPKWAFSRNGRPTITAKKNPDMVLGQRNGPSVSDLEKVNKMYNCKTANGDSQENSIKDNKL